MLLTLKQLRELVIRNPSFAAILAATDNVPELHDNVLLRVQGEKLQGKILSIACQ
jgi:hypothetical protein